MKIKDIGDTITGKTPLTAKEQYFNGDIPFVTPVDISRGYIINKTERYITDLGYDSIKPNVLDGLSVLVGCIGSDMGNVAITIGKCASNQQINAVTNFNENINPYYVYYSMSLKKKYFRQLAGATTTPILPKRIFDDIDIYIPSIEMQNRIVGVLKGIDDKIQNNNKINQELESMTKVIYDYWFLQFDFPDKNGKPYKSSGGKMVWNEMLKREIPKGWEVKDIGSMVEASRGISYNSFTLEGKGVPMINLASFNVDGSYKMSGIKSYSGEYTQDKILKPYDLVMCNTQQTAIDYKKDIIGKSFLVPDIFEGDIVSSHHVTTINVIKKNMKFYLNSLFNTSFFHKYISGFTNGTNILGLLFDGVEKYKVVVPSESVLEKFSIFISNIEKQKSLIMRENQELIALRDFLLPLLMNGQVGFKEE